MNEKTLRTLEFDKIREMLASFAINSAAKEKAMSLTPDSRLDVVKKNLCETDAASVMLC